MTLDVVPPASLAEYPGLGKGRVDAVDSVHPGRAVAYGLLVSSIALWCGSGTQAAQTAASAAKVSSEYYDVLGKRYNVLTSSNGYRERGVASWYGRPFDGRPTASGDMYDMNGMTAAHATLPLPTWVEVTNLKNGRRIVVKVNDRGPFVEKRLIDMSYAAAKKLDMVRDGTAHVEVRALPGPPPEKPPSQDKAPAPRSQGSTQAREQGNAPKPSAPPAPSPKSPAPPASPAKPRPDSTQHPPERLSPPLDPNRLFAEAGRFAKRDDAVQLVGTLKAEGVMNAFVVTEDRRRKSLHHVRVGPLADAAEVDSMNERLRGLGARRSHSVTMH
jgi:rare lipoprotein A